LPLRNLVTVLDEQPIPTLLPVRHLKPAEVLLVGSRRSHETSRHLATVLKGETQLHLLETRDPFNPIGVYRQLSEKMAKLGWQATETAFNLTGGTKMMAFGAYHLAHEQKSDLIYLEEREDRQDVLSRYHFRHGVAKLEEHVTLPPLLSIADYLNAHLPGFEAEGFSRDDRGHIDAGGRFEETVYHALEGHVDELLAGVRPAGVEHQIEIDLVVRCGNRVGIIEAKTGVKKAGIDQLDTAGGARYMGAYTAKILVTGRRMSRAHHALATARNIRIIELPGYREGRSLPDNERRTLIQTVHYGLACPRHK
jgi:hypothetical protein